MEKTQKYEPKTQEERKQEIEDLTRSMEERIPQYFQSEESIKEYLNFMGKFHNYSSNNGVLIESQFRGANAVGSFAFWKTKGFFVNKGEKAIKVIVPKTTTYFRRNEKEVQLRYATADEKSRIENKQLRTYARTYFSLGNVFDVSQTNATAKDLPDIFPNRWLEGSIENYDAMYKALGNVAESNGIKIVEPYDELGAAKGVSYRMLNEVALNPRNSDLQNVKTLTHELAHAVLHTSETHEKYTAQEKEFQAEMIAYTVSSYFNLDTSEYSLPYLHHWTNGKELKDQERLLKEARDTAHDFISTIEEELIIEREMDMDKEVAGRAFAEEFYERAHEHNSEGNRGLQVERKAGTDLVVIGYRESCNWDFIQVGDKELNILDYQPMIADRVAHDQDTTNLYNNDVCYISDRLNNYIKELTLRDVSKDEAEKFVLNEFTTMEFADERGIIDESLTDLFGGLSDFQSKIYQYNVENEIKKDILLVEYSSLSRTENQYVSMNELKELVEEKRERAASQFRNRSENYTGYDSEEEYSLLKNDWPTNDGDYIAKFNEVFQERYAAVDSRTLQRPSILIQWSESEKLEANNILPFSEANHLMGKLEEEYQIEQCYYKTRYHLLFPEVLVEDGKVVIVNMDRLDIGDGEYVNPHHQIRREKKLPETFQKAIDDEFYPFLQKEEEKDIDEWQKKHKKRIFQEMER